MLSPVAAGSAVTIRTAITHTSAIVLRRSFGIVGDGLRAVVLFSMNRRTIDPNRRGSETWSQCHARTVAK